MSNLIQNSVASLLLQHPFFGMVLGKLQLVIDNNIPTLATDGVKLMYNEEFAASLSKRDLENVLIHESLHVALGHPIRMRRFFKKFGIQLNENGTYSILDTKIAVAVKKMQHSTDYAVNDMIIDSGKHLPGDYLYDKKYHNMSWEEIFLLLPDPAFEEIHINCGTEGCEGHNKDHTGHGNDGQGNTPSNAKNGTGASKNGRDGHACGGLLPHPAQSDGDLDNAETQHRIMISQVAQLAKMCGRLPGAIEAFVNGLLEPKVNWAEQLRFLVEQVTRDDYSWTHANRRWSGSNFILPSLYSKDCGTIVVTCDTSGSVDDETLTQFSTEISDILQNVKPEKIVVLFCDTKVAHTQELEPSDLPIVLECKGRGGTDFRPAFTWIEENLENDIKVHIYLSDFYGPFPETEPPYPTIWVGEPNADKNVNIPFGDVIYMKA